MWDEAMSLFQGGSSGLLPHVLIEVFVMLPFFDVSTSMDEPVPNSPS